MSHCLVRAATTPLPPRPPVPSFARNTCLNPEETVIFLFFYFLSVSAARWPATLDHSSVVSLILFMTTTSPYPLPSSFHMFLFSSRLTPSAPPLTSPPLRYCLFEFAVSIVFPSSAASPVTEHRCNYAPIIRITRARPPHTNTQAVRQAGREASSRTRERFGCEIYKNQTQMNLIADLMGTAGGNGDLWGWEGTAGAALGEAR